MRYTFGDQAGTIPGIPGMFAHCSVEVDEAGNIIPSTPAVEVVQEEDAPAQETIIVQEPSADAPAPTNQVSTGG